jgi:hypothetical protein
MLKINPLIHQYTNPSLGPLPFFILSKFHPLAPPPPFKVHSSLIQGLFKVHSRFHSRLFLPVFKVVQGYSRLKSFSATLKILTHSLGFRNAPNQDSGNRTDYWFTDY